MKDLPLPEYIKFDFLLVLMGTGSTSITIYLVYFKESFLFNKELGIVSLLFVLLLMLFGFLMFTMGFYEMAQNYGRETKLSEIKFKAQELELKLQIKALQKEIELLK